MPKDFPKYAEAQSIRDKSKKLDFLEQSIKEDFKVLQKESFNNLLPYIQLHEFEALIFSSLKGINALFESSEADFPELEKIFRRFPNPEDINDDPNTAPSKRLLKHIEGYNKVVDGVSIIEEIGIETVIEKCPRFRDWLRGLIAAMGD